MERLVLAGVPVAVEQQSSVLVGRLHTLYDHARGGAGRAEVHLRIVEMSGAAPPLPAPPVVRWLVDRLLEGTVVGTRFVVSDGRMVGEVDYHTGQAELRLHQTDDATCYVATHHVFPILVGELLRLHGRYPLHGAALVSPEGSGRLLIGDSGTGKTTLCYRALELGWRCVADDGVLLAEEAGRVWVYPFYREPNLDPRLLRPKDRQRAVPIEPSREGPRFRLELDPAQWADRAPIDAVLLPHVKRDAPSLRRSCSRAEAFEELVRQNRRVLLYAPLARTHTRTLAGLTYSAPTATITCGPDLLQDADTVEALLAMSPSDEC